MQFVRHHQTGGQFDTTKMGHREQGRDFHVHGQNSSFLVIEDFADGFTVGCVRAPHLALVKRALFHCEHVLQMLDQMRRRSWQVNGYGIMPGCAFLAQCAISNDNVPNMHTGLQGAAPAQCQHSPDPERDHFLQDQHCLGGAEHGACDYHADVAIDTSVDLAGPMLGPLRRCWS